MARVLAYVDAVPGRLYPLVATLIELGQRGHHVGVRCGIDDVERLRALGLDARPLRSDIERFEPDDWRARTRFGALSSGLGQFGQRARFQLLDLEQAIEAEQPDVLFVDEGAWGAAATAERSGLPWGSRSSRRCRCPRAMRRRSDWDWLRAMTRSADCATGSPGA